MATEWEVMDDDGEEYETDTVEIRRDGYGNLCVWIDNDRLHPQRIGFLHGNGWFESNHGEKLPPERLEEIAAAILAYRARHGLD